MDKLDDFVWKIFVKGIYKSNLKEIKYNTMFRSLKHFHYSACLKTQSIFLSIYIED